MALIGAGMLAAGGALLLQVFAPSGEGLTLALWLAGLGACLAGSWLLYRPLSAGGGATPEGTALPILLLLAAAAFFFTLDWLPLPLHLDGRAAGDPHRACGGRPPRRGVGPRRLRTPLRAALGGLGPLRQPGRRDGLSAGVSTR